MRAGPHTRVALAALVVVTAAVTAASGQQGPLIPPERTFQILSSYLESLRQQGGIPGMSAAVVRDEEVVWANGFGFQNIEARVRATPDTPYLVGGLTSTLSAVLLLQCVEQRRLDLDEPFRRYGLLQPSPDATLRGVLSHEAPPGSETPYAYNPQQFDTLTQVMEWCAPQPFRKSIAHRILDNLAMRESVPGSDWLSPDFVVPENLFEPEDVDRYRSVLERAAIPYKRGSRGRAERTPMPVQSMTAANGLVTSVRDLVELDKAFDAGHLLLDETRELAWSAVTTGHGVVLPTGLGWFVQLYRGERVVWQFGYIPDAYSSLIVKVPERHLTFILLANSDGLSAPFDLASGDVTQSLFATLFLRVVR